MSELQKLYDEIQVLDPTKLTPFLLWGALLALIKVLIYKLEGKS